jgi:hypothetical protein
MDDWTASATARAVASAKATSPAKPVTLTQARFFMDDFHRSITRPSELDVIVECRLIHVGLPSF